MYRRTGKLVRAGAKLGSSVKRRRTESDFSLSRIADVGTFFAKVDRRMATSRRRRGSLGIVEIDGLADAGEADVSSPLVASLLRHVFESIERDVSICWHRGRLIVLTPKATKSRHILRQIWRTIATFSGKSGDGPKHLTPAIGYANLRSASNAGDLWDMAEDALSIAQSSLETEPFRHSPKLRSPPQARSPISFAALWSGVPQWFALSAQLMLSLMLGLGAPFVLYAVCDALGTDISGPVYLGVVAVLVLTATTIWIEGFLALRPTEPPKVPGSPAPVATIIIPAYLPNEADTIVETLHAFLRLEYQNKVQVIIAYNAPAPHLPVEDELRAIAASLPRDGRFLVEPIRVAGSTSKAQNVNAVIGRVIGDFVGIFDADHHPRPESLERAWRWLSNGWDIVQGRCSIRNGGDSWVSRMVAVEFEQIYAVSHPGRARFHGFGIFGGSNGFWRTRALHETRMRHSMLTEDIDSSIRAVEAGYRIAGDRDLISEELAPTGLNQLLNQRLRWAQGWFQVSFRRVMPALLSRRVTVRQKLGLLHLLVWRELFPWYSIQVVPILFYWIWVYGWAHIQWAVPIFLFTTIYTWSTGPGQTLLAYILAEKSMRRRPLWFLEYLFVSTFFYSPFKDTLSRVAHIKEAMRERAWRVTPRARTFSNPVPQFAGLAIVVLLSVSLLAGAAVAETPGRPAPSRFSGQQIRLMLGGEAWTIHRAREAARLGRNSEAAQLFAQAIAAVPARRPELLREYADSLADAGQNAQAAPLYRELLQSPATPAEDRPEMQRRLAATLARSRQFEAALAIYNDMQRQSRNDAGIAMRRAQMLSSLDRHDEAVEALDRIGAEQWTGRELGNLGEEILVSAARNAAKTGKNGQSAALFSRAIAHNPALKPVLAQEYADQLTYSSRAKEAIPIYREVIARKASADMVRRAQRGLSLALTWTKSPADAVGAWQSYLEQAPGDTDAQLHQAQAFAALHQSAKALAAYKTVLQRAPGNATARRGSLDETINLARDAARESRHGDAMALYAAAVQLDERKRCDLLREYADQISFAGHPGDAVAVYKEALAGAQLHQPDRKRAAIGLADAYAWSGQRDAAAKAYADLARTYADDTDLKWTSLVFAARKAAQSDENAEGARLFAEAIKAFPQNRAVVLREYADQLSFSGRAADAIPLYQEALGFADLSKVDQRATRVGLARAEAWSGKLAEAKIQYGSLARDFPDDADLKWNLIVVSARDAAQRNQNKEAANLFADAIKFAPQKAITIQREYADQLSFTGRAYRAIPLYVDFLSQPDHDEASRLSAKKALAEAYSWSNRLAEAKASYQELVAKYPADIGLTYDLTVVMARQAANADRNDLAASLFAKAIQLAPAKRSSLLKEYADKLTFSGQPKAAIPLYKELLVQQGTAAESRDLRLALALALAWNKQTDLALDEYQGLAVNDPKDDDAAIGVARMLSWKGRQAAAVDAYRRVLARSPDSPEAQRGLAQAEDWQGHHRIAQRILTERIRADPNDLEARRLMAQSQIWMGRPDKAVAELAIATAPPKKAPKNTRLASATPIERAPSVQKIDYLVPSTR